MATSDSSAWPPLPYAQWRDTCTTLHLWTQIVGKIRLQQTPWLNHGWHVPLYVTARGLTTSLIPYGERSFEMLFDFNDHALRIDVSDGARRQVALRARSVADFHAALMQQLGDLDMPVSISELPCEIGGAIPFSSDREHAAYDPEQARRFWRVLLQCDRVLKQFRTGFLGKSSPVHFFWGSFDLAVTRFSGRPAPAFSGNVPGVAATVMREAYSHEVSSAGFWPGGNGIDYPAFYSYAYPVPADFHARAVMPDEAFFSEALGEFLLPYEAVRTASDPDSTLLAFLQSTYAAAAESAHWDRGALERPIGIAGICPGTGH
ncbi:MAG TPA: DUF5996 family protein [Steroidobacteraceae bacterium]|jgi:hypothetical protein|nr:DUF5996 family protein [Steroidobacteraceae bacterium]